MTTKWEVELFDRLFDRTIVCDNGCWEFTGGCDKDGYGKISVLGITIPAHRASYDLCKGDIPKDIKVLHSCDNPPCINPDHLYLGTAQDNSDDMVNKGRTNGPKGSRQGQAKLNEDAVIIIRQLLNEGYSQREIARRFDVTQGAIYLIKHNKRWNHLGGEDDHEAAA